MAMDKQDKQKKKKDDWDPGITIAPMNGDELPKYRRMAYLNRKKKPTKEEREQEKNKYSKEDRRAIIRGGFLAMLPYLGIGLLAFAIAGVIIWLWLA